MAHTTSLYQVPPMWYVNLRNFCKGRGDDSTSWQCKTSWSKKKCRTNISAFKVTRDSTTVAMPKITFIMSSTTIHLFFFHTNFHPTLQIIHPLVIFNWSRCSFDCCKHYCYTKIAEGCSSCFSYYILQLDQFTDL